jgi:hypothetical protein
MASILRMKRHRFTTLVLNSVFRRLLMNSRWMIVLALLLSASCISPADSGYTLERERKLQAPLPWWWPWSAYLPYDYTQWWIVVMERLNLENELCNAEFDAGLDPWLIEMPANIVLGPGNSPKDESVTIKNAGPSDVAFDHLVVGKLDPNMDGNPLTCAKELVPVTPPDLVEIVEATLHESATGSASPFSGPGVLHPGDWIEVKLHLKVPAFGVKTFFLRLERGGGTAANVKILLHN